MILDKKHKIVIAILVVLIFVVVALILFSKGRDVEIFQVGEAPEPGGAACFEQIMVLESPTFLKCSFENTCEEEVCLDPHNCPQNECEVDADCKEGPAIKIEKSTNDKDADLESQAVQIKIGEKVTWEYVVTNTGNTNLENIKLTDNKEGDITCAAIPDVFASQESFTCIKESVAKEGLYSNEVSVTANPVDSSDEVLDSDFSHYRGVVEEEPEEENESPVCNDLRATPKDGTVDLKVRFDVEAEDPNGDKIEEYQYHFGDGNYAESGGDTIYHTYTKEGNFKAYVVVIDANGAESGEDECEATIKVDAETHTECQNQSCVEVEGEGVDKCSVDSECRGAITAITHLVCQNSACVSVSGSGSNECVTNTDCQEVTDIPVTGSKESLIFSLAAMVLIAAGGFLLIR